MLAHKDPNKSVLSQDASLGELVTLILKFGSIVKEFRYTLLIWVLGLGTVGALLGLFSEKKYKAEYIIATEQEGSSGWDGLLAQFGLDIGGSNPGGVFEGESLVRLFQVRTLVERSLLRPVGMSGDTTLAQIIFKDVKGADGKKFQNLFFKEENYGKNRLQDTALFLLYQHVVKEILSVNKPEKKEGFIHVSCTHENEAIAEALSQALIETVTKFYIESLTKKARYSLGVLRTEADSVQRLLNSNIQQTAEYMDMNINPLRQTARVLQNRSTIDLQISVTLYGEMIKNLKLAEIGLRKQTPLIQIIEEPHFPLETVGWEWWKSALYGILAGLIMASRSIVLKTRKE